MKYVKSSSYSLKQEAIQWNLELHLEIKKSINHASKVRLLLIVLLTEFRVGSAQSFEQNTFFISESPAQKITLR